MHKSFRKINIILSDSKYQIIKILFKRGGFIAPDCYRGIQTAGGPLAGALLQGDESLAESLTYYGVSGEYAAQMENFVNEGYLLTVIETNSSKASEVANLLNKFGAHMVQKWSRTIDNPIHPWN